MNKFVRLIVILVMLFSIGLTSIAAQSGAESAFLRFVHVIPGVTAVDVYTNGQLSISGLDYGEASNYISAPAGTLDITVRSSGLTTILWQQQVGAAAGEAKTLVASTIDPLAFDVYDDDFTTPNTEFFTRLRIIHAISNAGAINITAGADAVASGMNYRESVGAFDVPADVYELGVVTADGTTLANESFGLYSNSTNMIIFYGTASIPASMTLTAPTASNSDSGFIRVAHTVIDAPAVDVFANGTKVISAIEFGEITVHLPFPNGSYEMELRPTGSDEALIQGTLSLGAGDAMTVLAMGSAAEVSIGTFTDDLSGVDENTAVINVINAISGDSSVTASLADGTLLADAVAFNSAGGATSIEPSNQAVFFTVSIDGQSATLEIAPEALYGGVYYNAIALDGTMFSPPTLIFAPTSLSQGIASAPGAGNLVVAQPTTAPEVVAVEPTAVPEVSVATEVPAATAVPTSLPVVLPEAEFPTARILLDPGANLQLRQYPDPTSLSLGLAPSGATLIVNGREGAPVDLDGNEIPIILAAESETGQDVFFVDPAINLDPEDEKADIDPQTTWLNVTYTTPDGGQIIAWVNAFYLEVRNPDGDLQRLVELPMIPRNDYGNAVNTEVTPPPIQKNRVTVTIVNLAAGSNLNIRRTTDLMDGHAMGEVLARVSNGTVAELIGVGESGNWVFVSYAPPEGGTITGWASSQFVNYQVDGQDVTLERLAERALLVTIPDDPANEATRRGSVTEGAATVAQPTQDPTLDAYVAEVAIDPGANLNLRRNPDASSEVLVRIPSGAQIIVSGRTEDMLWLLTSFENQTGWVAAGTDTGQVFVVVRYNGEWIEDISEIPVVAIPAATEETEESNG